jgi:hypothetical protein
MLRRQTEGRTLLAGLSVAASLDCTEATDPDQRAKRCEGASLDDADPRTGRPLQITRAPLGVSSADHPAAEVEPLNFTLHRDQNHTDPRPGARGAWPEK